MRHRIFNAIGEGLFVGPFLFVTFSLGTQRKSKIKASSMNTFVNCRLHFLCSLREELFFLLSLMKESKQRKSRQKNAPARMAFARPLFVGPAHAYGRYRQSNLLS